MSAPSFDLVSFDFRSRETIEQDKVVG
jgi:hypothetical protein